MFLIINIINRSIFLGMLTMLYKYAQYFALSRIILRNSRY